MERLWSPWRMEYIRSSHDQQGCIFCDKPKEGDDQVAYILARREKAYALLNAYPYNPGHLMIAPFRHMGELDDLDSSELSDVDALLQQSLRVLKEAVGPDGFNVGVNLGRVAGAGIVDHVHWHVVPRWNGDTNFMPVIGETRVLPELLSDTYAKLRPLFTRDAPA
jgi:ATP adenylyltransferase